MNKVDYQTQSFVFHRKVMLKFCKERNNFRRNPPGIYLSLTTLILEIDTHLIYYLIPKFRGMPSVYFLKPSVAIFPVSVYYPVLIESLSVFLLSFIQTNKRTLTKMISPWINLLK